MTQPTDRPGIDQLTSDMLDQLYADLDWAREQTLAAQQETTEAATRAERAEATLTAVREVAAYWDRVGQDPNACIDMDAAAIAIRHALAQQHGQTPQGDDVIQPGQIYRSLSNRHHPADGPIRIKVIRAPLGAQDIDGMRKVQIATLTKTGREIRHRWIRADKLHPSPKGAYGKPRRTGYVLEGGQTPA